MKTRKTPHPVERLIRVRTTRRGKPIELRVHYEIRANEDFRCYRILSAVCTGTY